MESRFVEQPVGRRQVFDWGSEFKGSVTSGEDDEHSVRCLRAEEMKMRMKWRGHVIGNRGISVREALIFWEFQLV